MNKIGEAFAFVPPFGWEESRRGATLVFRQLERELRVSFWPLKEKGSLKKKTAALEELKQTALKDIGRDLKNTNLRVAIPLSRVDENKLEFWVQSLGTRDGTTLICSAVACSPLGILMVSLEAPNKPRSFPIFVDFLRSVHKA